MKIISKLRIRGCLPIRGGVIGIFVAGLVTIGAIDGAFAERRIPRPSQPIPIGTNGENEALPDNVRSELGVFPNSEYDDLYRGLHDICPCLFIRVLKVLRGEGSSSKRRGGAIIIRHPGDTADLDSDVLDFKGDDVVRPANNVRNAVANVTADKFCDCYERYRAGCNLVWSIAMAPTPPTLWKRGLGESSAATPVAGGHVGWNSADTDSDKAAVPDDEGAPTDRTTTDRPSSLGLAHELAHALNAIRHQMGSTNRSDYNWEEFKAARMENQIRAEMLADALRKRKDRSNTLLDDDDIRELGPRVEYNKGRTIPNPTAGTIPLNDLFDCPPKVGFIPGHKWRDGDGIFRTPTGSALLACSALPGQAACIATNISTDSQAYCTYGTAAPAAVVFEPADELGNPTIAISAPPEQPRDAGSPRLALPLASTPLLSTPRQPASVPQQSTPEQPTPPQSTPQPTPEQPPPEQPAQAPPPEQPTPQQTVQQPTPEQPTQPSTPEEPPPKEPGQPDPPASTPPPSSTPSEVTIHIKATEAVLEGQTASSDLKGQVVKLVALTTPDLPKPGGSKPDAGFDRGPVTCVTGTDGRCSARIPGDERQTYGFPNDGASNYRADLNLRPSTGGVIDRTGALKATPAVPAGALVTKSDFKIGNKTFTRLDIRAPDSVADAFLTQHKDAFGPRFQVDYCAEKKPGPPLGMEAASSTPGRALPEATISLRHLQQRAARR